MKVFVLLALVLATVLSMNMMAIEESPIDSNNDGLQKIPNNLQISNVTAPDITSDMVSVFIKTINDAYTFYRDNVTQNANYIQNKLEGAYTYYFQVLIFPENSTADCYLYKVGNAFVIWSKVNTAKPQWLYIIIGLSTTTLKRTSISGTYQKGTGISSNLQKVLQNIIKKYETGKSCQCLAYEVQVDLQTFDGQRWHVVCSSPKNPGNVGFGGIIYQKDDIYEQTVELTSGRCRYLAWVAL